MSNLYHDGQEVTVIDAQGVRGRGVMRKDAMSPGFMAEVRFDHTLDGGERHDSGARWYFSADEVSDYGLTIEPHPFTEEAPVSGVDPRDAEITRLREEVRRLRILVGEIEDSGLAAVAGKPVDALAAVVSPRRDFRAPDPVEGEEK